MEIAISTSWNYFKGLESMLEEIRSAGFNRIELSFHFNNSQLQKLKKLISKYEISVISVHNYAPFPLEDYQGFPSPDFYSLSSKDREERKLALKATEATLETAYEFRAQVVLLHTGKVEGIDDRTVYFYRLKNSDPGRFKSELEDYLKLRQKKARRHLEVLKFSMEALLKKVEKLNLKIALEARYYLHEIPELEELKDLMECFSSPVLGYWHDSGHVKVKEILEIHSQSEYLDILSKHLIGIHYHDVVGIEDHKLPGRGELDFLIFKPYYSKSINVLEIHPPANVNEVSKALHYLVNLYGEKDSLFTGKEDSSFVK